MSTQTESKNEWASLVEALKRWFSQAYAHQLPISCPFLMQKAAQLAQGLGFTNLKAKSEWLHRWKIGYSIQLKKKKQHGDRHDEDYFGTERWTMD
jgi:hypothetical protein